MAGERVRKVRSDKKRAVSALVDLDTFDLIARIAYICEKPVKDIGEQLCQEGLNSKKILDRMSQRFRRALETGNTIFMGDKNRQPFRWAREAEKRRVQMRFLEIHHERIASVAYALDATVSAGAGWLLKSTLDERDIVSSGTSKKHRRNGTRRP